MSDNSCVSIDRSLGSFCVHVLWSDMLNLEGLQSITSDLQENGLRT